MKIVIAGAGAVGTHLAKMLSREKHDIILIDHNPERLETPGANLDLMTVAGSPIDINTLKQAEVADADLVIAVTPDEAHNMTCCILSRKLGAKKTVARVDNAEFTKPEHTKFFKEIGIDSIIYPEMLAGREIINTIRRSWIRQWWEMQEGALVMLSVKVREGASLVGEGQPLKVICGPEAPFHIVAIKRGNDTIIPHGDDRIMHLDTVFFMTTPEYLNHIKAIAGKQDYPSVRNIIIMGGSDTAVQTVQHMPDYIHAKLIEDDASRCKQLSAIIDNPNVLIIRGNGQDIDLLEDENIKKTDAFAALTESSEKNILACLEAKKHGVRKTVAVVENTDYIPMAESLDIGTIVNKKTIAASHIYRMLLKADTASVKSLTVANADVAEFPVMEGARITRHFVKDLALPSNVTLGGLVRNGRGILINGNTQILPGDIVVAFCLHNGIQKLEKFF